MHVVPPGQLKNTERKRTRDDGMLVEDGRTFPDCPPMDAPGYQDPRRSEPSIRVTAVHLALPPTLSFDQWNRAGRQLAGVVDSSSWWLGDWLVYGKREYPDRYIQAIKIAGLSYQTLRNYAWVARRFEPGRRRVKLTFQHHAEVASLSDSDQDRWLDHVEVAEWTTRQLRDALRADAGSTALATTGEKTSTSKLQVSAHRMARWRKAANRAGRNVDDWVLHVVDTAAADLLEQNEPTAEPCGIESPATAAPIPDRLPEGTSTPVVKATNRDSEIYPRSKVTY